MADKNLTMPVPIIDLLADWAPLEVMWAAFLAGEPEGRSDSAWALAAAKWIEADELEKDAKVDAKAAEKEKANARDELIALAETGDESQGCGVKVVSSTRKGNIDWEAMVAKEMADGDKEKARTLGEGYRKPETTFHRVSAL